MPNGNPVYRRNSIITQLTRPNKHVQYTTELSGKKVIVEKATINMHRVDPEKNIEILYAMVDGSPSIVKMTQYF